MEKSDYMNPYLAGFFLGLILLATFFIAGRGLGASGAIKDGVVAIVSSVAPEHAANTPFYQKYLKSTAGNPLKAWLVFELLGVVIGGFISGMISGRLTLKTEHGPRIKPSTRWIMAVLGGMLFGIGAQFGRGCTSGAALSGMAVLSAGGYIVMVAIFGTGFALAWFFRKLWI